MRRAYLGRVVGWLMLACGRAALGSTAANYVFANAVNSKAICPVTILQLQYSGVSYEEPAFDDDELRGHVTLNANSSSSQAKAQADITSPDSLWEVRLSPGKGRGVFATRRIAAGTRIYAEDPLFSIQPPEFHPGQGFRVGEVAAAVDAAVAGLSEEERAEFYACHEHRGPHEVNSDAQRNLFILRSNAYMLPNGRSAMFPRLARVNHSCRPNTAHLWNSVQRGDRVVWAAARDIEAGEEITVTYVNVLMTAAERGERLAQYGFACDCAACTAQRQSDDLRRARMGTLLKTLQDNPEGRGNDGITALGENLQLLRWAEELVVMLEEDALMDYLPQVYGYAAKLSSILGDDKAAVDWSRKEASILNI